MKKSTDWLVKGIGWWRWRAELGQREGDMVDDPSTCSDEVMIQTRLQLRRRCLDGCGSDCISVDQYSVSGLAWHMIHVNNDNFLGVELLLTTGIVLLAQVEGS